MVALYTMAGEDKNESAHTQPKKLVTFNQKTFEH